MKLSKSQQAAFWRMFTAAANEAEVPKAERDEWRHKLLFECAGVSHLGDLDKTEGFDNVMGRLAELSGDYESAIHFTGGGVRRYRSLIEQKVRELLRAKGRANVMFCTVEAYVTGILFQSRLIRTNVRESDFAARLAVGSGWDDIPENVLRTLLQIVNSELRKVVRT